MAGFMDFLASAFDSVFAPASALDNHSGGHCDSLTTSMHVDTGGGAGVSDWTNAWGTQADHQVAAESGDMFQSSDWGTGCDMDSGSSFGDEW